MSKKNKAREFSHLIKDDELSTSSKQFDISADSSECAAIAQRIGVLSVESLTAHISCTIESGHIIHVTGQFTAHITQECVVTLEPIQSVISDECEGWYSDHEHIASFKKAQYEAKSKKEFIETPILDEKDDPEPLENGYVDVGELVVQFLSLSINHYAHKEGVSLDKIAPQIKADVDNGEPLKKYAPQNPFAALKNWRPKD